MHTEEAVIVTLTEHGVSCTHPDGSIEAVEWDDLQAVIIETTDKGPYAADVFWILVGKKGGCVAPQGATGEDELFIKLQGLAGFDNEAVLSAMACSENKRFLCWEK